MAKIQLIDKLKSKTNTKKTLQLIGKGWSMIFLLILIGFFSLRGVNFFTIKSIQNVLLASSLIMLVAIGETFVIISGGIDISPAYVVGLTAAVGAVLMRELNSANFANQTIIIIFGTITILMFSLIPGLFNGLIIAKLKVPSFIVTIGTMSIAEGAVFLLNNGQPITGVPQLMGKIGNSSLLYWSREFGLSFFRIPEGAILKETVSILPIPIIVILLVATVGGFILSRTIFGQHVYAVGGNKNAAKVAGIPVDLTLIKVYMIASLMYGFAGLVYVSRFSIASPNAGEPLLMSSVGAVFIGGASMGGGIGTIGGTVIGALVIAILQTGLVMSNVSPFWQYIAVGSVIILAVLFDRYKAKFLLK